MVTLDFLIFKRMQGVGGFTIGNFAQASAVVIEKDSLASVVAIGQGATDFKASEISSVVAIGQGAISGISSVVAVGQGADCKCCHIHTSRCYGFHLNF